MLHTFIFSSQPFRGIRHSRPAASVEENAQEERQLYVNGGGSGLANNSTLRIM